MILHNYAAMPMEPTRNLYVLYPEKGEEKEGDQDANRDDNILVEKQYLSTYWHYFRVSIGVQSILMSCVAYGGATIAIGKFNGSFMRSICGVGLVLHMYGMYLKRI